MSSSTRLHRAVAVIPLAVLSAAWTASLAGAGADSAGADTDGSRTLPDGTVLPAAVIVAPASVGDPVTRTAAATTGSASDIPQAALSAYQRAEAVINEADKGCNLPWELLAAVGRVESDHGRFGGSSLDDRGVARPGIYGIALTGRNDTQRILDTDAGQYDDDTRFDRAVGPMQFIPSTWSVVGVDGDSDGSRDPQDVDDAALAAAVYLCSGDDDLSAEQGQRASVFRYNHSNAYVDMVLEIMQAYMDGDFSAAATSTLTAGVIVPGPTAPTGGHAGNDGKGVRKGDSSPTRSSNPAQTPTAQTQSQTQAQSQNPSPPPTEGPTKDPTVVPPIDPTTLPSLATTLPPLPAATITRTLTWAEARARCLASSQQNVDACIAALLNP